jgi:hypothetical protein
MGGEQPWSILDRGPAVLQAMFNFKCQGHELMKVLPRISLHLDKLTQGDVPAATGTGAGARKSCVHGLTKEPQHRTFGTAQQPLQLTTL